MKKELLEDEMNPIYWTGVTWFRSLARAIFDHQVVGQDKLIEEGGALICCNHESFLDPPMVGISFRNRIFYLARKTLFRSFGGWLYPRWNAIPIDQENPDPASLKTIIKLLKGGNRVLMFPEGERSMDGKLLPGKAGVGLVAAKSKVPVQPVRIFGAYESLPRGSGKLKPQPITIVVGDPIDFTEEEKSGRGKEGYQRIADRIMAEIAKLERPPGR
ncbi:MAG: lysophospholipid acyltransferase family protein [Verrucomicrobiota bacterium JB023]|nr:lysophospholipid acyltransferase family protein [Verrucomicrobiota bacterium JB023]